MGNESSTQQLRRYNGQEYSDQKHEYFGEPHQDTEGKWYITLYSPPQYSGMIGEGNTIEAAKDDAAEAHMNIMKNRASWSEILHIFKESWGSA